MKKDKIIHVPGRKMTDAEIKGCENTLQMFDNFSENIVLVIRDYLIFRYPHIKIEKVEGKGLDTVLFLSLENNTCHRKCEFALQNYLLEVFTLDRDERPLQPDTQIFVDYDYFHHKAGEILFNRIFLLVALLESTSDDETEQVLKTLYSTGKYERIRCQSSPNNSGISSHDNTTEHEI